MTKPSSEVEAELVEGEWQHPTVSPDEHVDNLIAQYRSNGLSWRKIAAQPDIPLSSASAIMERYRRTRAIPSRQALYSAIVEQYHENDRLLMEARASVARAQKSKPVDERVVQAGIKLQGWLLAEQREVLGLVDGVHTLLEGQAQREGADEIDLAQARAEILELLPKYEAMMADGDTDEAARPA